MKWFSWMAVLAGTWIAALNAFGFDPLFTSPVVNRWDIVESKFPDNFIFTDWRSVPQLRAAGDFSLPLQNGQPKTERRQEYAALSDSRVEIERLDGRLVRKRERFVPQSGRMRVVSAAPMA